MLKLVVLFVLVFISCVSFAKEFAARKTEQTLVQLSKKEQTSKLSLQTLSSDRILSIEENQEDEPYWFNLANLSYVGVLEFGQFPISNSLNSTVLFWKSFKTKSYLYEICVLRL
jgi:hypothetical protein